MPTRGNHDLSRSLVMMREQCGTFVETVRLLGFDRTRDGGMRASPPLL